MFSNLWLLGKKLVAKALFQLPVPDVCSNDVATVIT